MTDRPAVPSWLALMVAVGTGYLSLSQEILWVRAIGYSTGSQPQIFGHVVGFFLIGIALGAVVGKRVTTSESGDSLRFISRTLFASSGVYYLSFPVCAFLMTRSVAIGTAGFYGAVGLVAFLIGGVFPVLCHVSIRSGDAVGRSLSWIYGANIVGAAAGPLVTGFLLLDTFSIGDNVVILTVLTMALAGLVTLATPANGRRKLITVGGMMVGFACAVIGREAWFDGLLEKLHYKETYASAPRYRYLIENRSGVIAVEPDSQADIIYGGGAYDGRFNLDPVLNSNGITRAYMVSALHRAPANVLEIGLSSASWSRVLADYSRVSHLTIVEINPGYSEIVRRYPDIGSVLTSPKVTLHYDDGRRWLLRNPSARFDLVVMNTTWHWRDHTTNLLSAEFMQLVRHHLRPGGVFYFNTTASRDAAYTAARVFRFVTPISNFIAASDAPFSLPRSTRSDNLRAFVHGGIPVFPVGHPSTMVAADSLANMDVSDMGDSLRSERGLWYVTEDNMATEFKHPGADIRFDPSSAWGPRIVRTLRAIVWPGG